MRSRIRLWLFFAACQILCALLASKIILYNATSLRFIRTPIAVAKQESGIVMGSSQTQVTRQTLAGNQLNLGAWHSFQELDVHELPPGIRTIELSAKLDSESMLTVFYGKEGDRDLGIRFSLNPEFPSASLAVSREGHFESRRPLGPLPLNVGWNRFTIKSVTGTEEIEAQVNGRVRTIPRTGSWGNRLGFRNSSSPVSIAMVKALDESGKPVLDEDFTNRVGDRAIFLFCLVITLSLSALFGRLSGSISSGILFTLWVMGLLSGYGAWDFLYFSYRYPFKTFTPEGLHPTSLPCLRFEEIRKAAVEAVLKATAIKPLRAEKTVSPVVTQWSRSIVRYSDRLKDKGHETLPQTTMLGPYGRLPACRIAAIGTSQTWGTGAADPEHTWIGQLYQSVREGTFAKHVELFNLSIRGSDSAELLNHYRLYWKEFRPKLLLINLGYNDGGNPQLPNNLSSLIGLAPMAKVVLLREASARDGGHYTYLRNTTHFYEKFSAERGVTFLDLNAYLNSPAIFDSGFLWWDSVHLTPYAQRLTANWLWEHLRSTFREVCSRD